MSADVKKEVVMPKRGGKNGASTTSKRWLKEPTTDDANDVVVSPDFPKEPPRGPVRLPPKQKFDVADVALPIFAVATGAMVGLSAPHLIDPSGFSGWIKIGILTGSATLVSYITNRFAVEQGADLTSRGYWTAGVVSVGSILFVGGGLFASTYAGLTIERVNDLHLQRHGQGLVHYIGTANKQAAKAARVKPAIDSAEADIKFHVACEIRESCLSGRGRGGRGPVTRAIEPVATRSQEISSQLQKGEAIRGDKLARLNQLIGMYQTTFSDSSLSAVKRRRALSRIDAKIKQDVSALSEAIPIALLASYGAELNQGMSIAKRPEATRNVNALLRRHGRSVETALDGIGQLRLITPTFPSVAGVSSTFAYMGHFLPIAALTAVIELVMPLTLWIYMLLSHLWRNYRDDPWERSQPTPKKKLSHKTDGGDDA